MYAIQTKNRKNSRHYDKTIFTCETESQIKEYLNANNLIITGKPYIFTHLNLSDGSIITCSYNGIICSPQDLEKYLSTNS